MAVKKLEINSVTKTLGKNKVLDNVTLSASGGEIIGLKGVNGSGKTMIMRLVAGLIKPDSGSVLIDSKVLGRDMTFPRSIGILIENPAFLDSYSGFDNLRLLSEIKRTVDENDIKKTIEGVGLDPEDKKKYRKYSLGMKQRLGIAAAVMEKPDIILLDEPMNALDADGVEMVKNLLARERERGALIIISCHDSAVLEDVSDRIYLVRNGRVSPAEANDEKAC